MSEKKRVSGQLEAEKRTGFLTLNAWIPVQGKPCQAEVIVEVEHEA